MADVGVLADLVLAQSVRLLINQAIGDSKAAADDFVTMLQVRAHKSHPESRYNYGMKRNYQHGAPDIGLSFSVSTSKEIVTQLNTWSKRNLQGEIPIRKYAVEYTDLKGIKKMMTFEGKLRDVDQGKQRNTQQDPVDANCFIRITSDEITVS